MFKKMLQSTKSSLKSIFQTLQQSILQEPKHAVARLEILLLLLK